MIEYRFYDPTTGLFHGRAALCQPRWVAASTPPGYVPIRGAFDTLRQRVDIDAKRPDDADESWQPPVIDYQPPPIDEAVLKLAAEQSIRDRLAAEDGALLRPLAELVLAMADGSRPPAEALARLQDIEARKQAMRETLTKEKS